MQKEQPQQFAYGCDVYDGQPCPAQAAGFSPESGDMSTQIAEQYDEILRASYSDKGTVEESEAKQAWLEAIDYFERTAEQALNDCDREHYERLVEIGEKVADELGWL